MGDVNNEEPLPGEVHESKAKMAMAKRPEPRTSKRLFIDASFG